MVLFSSLRQASPSSPGPTPDEATVFPASSTVLDDGVRPLAQQLKTATRQTQSQLDRLITARLPYCLPPLADSPRLYALGILNFARIYLEFEDLWLHFILGDSESLEDEDALETVLDPRTYDIIRTVMDLPLVRMKILTTELPQLLGVSLEHLHRLPVTPSTDGFAAHIREVVSAKPHLLVAFAWVMYARLFSGGRWIRGQLRAAGPAFWSRYPSRAKPTRPTGLGFFYFADSAEEELQLQSSLKKRIDEIDSLLEPQERAEIVIEAVKIMDYCAQIVRDLDGYVEEVQRGRLDIPLPPEKDEQPRGIPRARRADRFVPLMRASMPPVSAVLLAVGVWLCWNGLDHALESLR